jgi:hypothetical protein
MMKILTIDLNNMAAAINEAPAIWTYTEYNAIELEIYEVGNGI